MLHRIATAGYYTDTLIQIQTQWSLDDIMDATVILDIKAKLEQDSLKE